MKRHTLDFASVLLAGGLMASSAWAAPPPPPPGHAIDCNDPAMARTPACMRAKGTQPHRPMAPGVKPAVPPPAMQPAPTPSPAPPMQHGPMTPRQPPMQVAPPPHGGPPPGFDAFRHSYHFPHFVTPNFTARPGMQVPRSYHRHLRQLPPPLLRFYPRYHGYLFFVTPRGDIVIVNPRTLRIVAVL